MKDVAIVILAAGASSRLGRPKQTLPLAGEPLVAHVVRTAQQANADRLVVVLGGAAGEVERALADRVEEVVTNPAFAEGIGTSIATAVRYLETTSALLGEIGAVVFLLADQPGVDPVLIDEAILQWRNGAKIVSTRYRGQPGHPVLFDHAYWHELAALRDDEGGRRVLRAHPEAVVTIEVDEAAPIDVDTESDWRNLQEMWPS